MTEVVTSFAASQQLNLSARGLQGFGVSAPVAQPAAPTAESNALQSALAASDKSETESFKSELQGRDPGANSATGPSRPRIEIKQFDVGLSPSVVVGTQDVLQRFDANGDGRVDTLEADKATLVRQKVFTFAGLAAAPTAASPEQAPVPVTVDNAPQIARETGEAIAALKSFDENGLPKKYSDSIIQDPGAKKYFAEAAAAEGTPSGVADAPKKYYGQGAEVVAGSATSSTPAPVKYADRVPARDQAVSEDGTGEVKYYDRVAQSEPGDNDGNTTGEKYSDKAQEIAAAYAVAQGDAPVEVPVATVVTA